MKTSILLLLAAGLLSGCPRLIATEGFRDAAPAEETECASDRLHAGTCLPRPESPSPTVVVTPDGRHAVVMPPCGNSTVVVNPDGSHSIALVNGAAIMIVTP